MNKLSPFIKKGTQSPAFTSLVHIHQQSHPPPLPSSFSLPLSQLLSLSLPLLYVSLPSSVSPSAVIPFSSTYSLFRLAQILQCGGQDRVRGFIPHRTIPPAR